MSPNISMVSLVVHLATHYDENERALKLLYKAIAAGCVATGFEIVFLLIAVARS